MRFAIYFSALLVLAFSECNKKSQEIEILKEPLSVYQHKVGDRVSIVCAAHAEPEPIVYWRKGTGKRKVNLPVRASGKSVLYFDEITKEDFDKYVCVVETCCNGKKKEIEVEIVTPGGPDCNKQYGDDNLVFGVDWAYATHSEAKDNCEALGLELAIVHNEAENAKMLDDIKISFNRHPDAKKFSNDNWVWIGGNDVAKEGTWIDIYTQKELVYYNWDKPNQPDNWIGDVGTYYYNEGGQDYLAFNRETGKWDDSFATHQRPYVCKCPSRKG